MTNDFFLELLNEHILTKDNDRKTDDQFLKELNNIEPIVPNYPSKHEIDFKRPIYPIRKYYYRRISNEVITIFNSYFKVFLNKNLKKEYSLHYQEFYDFLSDIMRKIDKYLYNKGVKASFYLNPKYSHNADQAYIIFFLKANMIMLLMELQDSFGEYSTTDILNTEEIYEYFFNESIPEILPFKLKSSISKTQSVRKEGEEDYSIKFKPILGDIESRLKDKKIISFKRLIKKTDKFLSLETKLFNNNIIDDKYNFIADRGNKQLLAAFIHQLIRHDYLQSRLFPGNIIIKERDITKFFAIRYGSFSDCDKEFRNFKNKDRHKLQKLIDSNFWLDSLI